MLDTGRVYWGKAIPLLSQFNSPTAVAYKNKIVWVCDTGNGRVLRFKLTTDFQ